MSIDLAAEGESLVNTTSLGDQSYVSIAALVGGGYVVVWQSDQEDPTWSHDVYARLYDADGVALGAEFRVNANDPYSTGRPHVSALADGGFVVTWEMGVDFSGSDIFVRRFDASGSAVQTEASINATDMYQQSYARSAGLADGGYVVVYVGQSAYGTGVLNQGEDFGVFLKRFDAAGQQQGGEVLVNTTIAGAQDSVQIAALNDGGYVVVWQDYDGELPSIRAQLYDASGVAIGGEARAEDDSAAWNTGPNVAALAEGGYVIVWNVSGSDSASGSGYLAQRYDADGHPLGSNTVIWTDGNPATLAVAGLPDGGFVVTFQETDGSDLGVKIARFDAYGNAVGDPGPVNTYTLNTQHEADIAALADGGLAVVWMSVGQDGSGWGIYQQAYLSSSGPTEGPDYLEGTPLADTIDGLGGDDVILGFDGADTLTGGSGNDRISGGGGNDTLGGGEGIDTLDLSGMIAANVSMGTPTVNGQVNGPNSEFDVFSGFERFIGTPGNDTFAYTFGEKTIDGGAGFDTVAALAHSVAITPLATNLVDPGTASLDVAIDVSGQRTTIDNVERTILQAGAGGLTISGDFAPTSLNGQQLTFSAVFATNLDATGLTSATPLRFFGGGGNSTFRSAISGADDYFNGEGGLDTVDYSAATAAVVVDLTAGTASGSQIGADQIIDVDNVIGGSGNDTITGTTGSNTLTGGGGADTINGGEGDDIAVFSGALAEYDVTQNADGSLRVVHSRGSLVDGEDVLDNVETLRFSDGDVAASEALNEPPTAIYGSTSLAEDTSVQGSVTGQDPDGDDLSFAVVDAPLHGVLTFSIDGTFTYAPDEDFYGSDQFSFRASDGREESAPATFSLTVTPVNDAPVAASDAVSLIEDFTSENLWASLLANDYDLEGDLKTIVSVLTTATKGTVVFDAQTQTLTYAADHPDFDLLNLYGNPASTTDTFTYVMQDSFGAQSTATVTVTILAQADGATSVQTTTKADIIGPGTGTTAGEDVVHANSGADIVNGGDGADQLYGDQHDDFLWGATGHDRLFGGQGKDTLFGGADQDLLQGGLGNDQLYGGEGADVFQFLGGKFKGELDIIWDFTGQDRIWLESGLTVISATSGTDFTGDGIADTLLKLSSQAEIMLSGFTAWSSDYIIS